MSTDLEDLEKNMKRSSLEDVAKIESWIDFGEALAEAMSEPASYDMLTPSEVLQHVAQIRGKRPHTLRNPVETSKWLKEKFPEVFAQRPAWLGMTLILFLMKIESLNPERAAELAPRVLSGQMKQTELKAEFDRLRQERTEQQHPENMSGLSSAHRAMLFDQSVLNFLRQYSPKIFGSEEAQLKDGRCLGSLHPDYVVEVDGTPKVAIEINPHRTRVERQFTINTLGYLWLLRRLVPEVLLIVPQDSGYELSKLAQMRNEIGLDGIRFATLPETGAKKLDDLIIQD